MGTVWQEVRFGIRMLAKNRGYTAVAVIALALGIGANTAIFSVVNAVLLRPLPFADQSRLVFLRARSTGPVQGAADVVSSLGYLDYREQTKAFTSLAAIAGSGLEITGESILEGGREPEYVPSGEVSYNFFDTLGLKPLLGHSFTREDEDPYPNRVVILSYELWRNHFGGDRNIIGRSILLTGNPCTVIGVMPAGIHFPPKAQLWFPYPFSHDRALGRRYFRAVQPIGRLNGLTLQQAQADVDIVSARRAEQYPALNAGRGVQLIKLREVLTGEIRLSLLVLLAAAGFVLLIACANVANLQLARASTRRKEIAIRTALGAGRAQIVRQLLMESTLLALLGGLLGLLLAYAGVRLLIALSPADLSSAADGTLDPSVLAFTLLLSVATGIAFGLAPATETANVNLTGTLKEGGRTTNSGKHRLRRLLVVGEIAMALVLLVGAGLMLESFAHLENVKPGFNPDKVLTLLTVFSARTYDTRTSMYHFCTQLLSRVRALPGVQSAGIVYLLPLGGATINQFFTIDGRGVAGEKFSADLHWLSSGALETLQVPLLRGRLFTEREAIDLANVILVSAEMARRYFPGENPIGQHINLGEGTPPEHRRQEIIGVVGNVRHRALDTESYPALYRPNLALRWSYLLVRTAGDPMNLAPAVRAQFRDLDSNQPITDVKLLETVVNASVSRPRFRTLLLGLFAMLALVLATVGIYGVIAYSVSQSRHDIGIRLALGAQPGDVLRLILRQGLLLAMAGSAAGIPAAFALVRFVSSFLFEVSPFSPTIYVGIAALLTVVALLASYVPARRATRLDPISVLRSE